MSETWGDYCGTQRWYHLKDAALARANFQCEGELPVNYCPHFVRCENRENLEMHHDIYPDSPSEDRLGFVRILCRDCHQEFHDNDGDRGYSVKRCLSILAARACQDNRAASTTNTTNGDRQ
jgi:hypothetical protein